MKFIDYRDTGTIVQTILSGGVALLPTDTVYGLSVLPTNAKSIEKVFDLKLRPERVALPIMVADLADLYELSLDINQSALSLLHSPFIPGPLTLVLGFKDQVRPIWLAGRDEVAIRIPNSTFLRSILSETGPLLFTSANKHGSNINMGVLAEILLDLNGEPDIIVDMGILSNKASTIVNCRHSELVFERLGQITKEDIIKHIGNE